MQHLVPVSIRRLRVAAARLRTEPRRSGIDRAIWIAARNYRRDALADQSAIDNPQLEIALPAHLVDRIDQLAPEPTALAAGGADTDSTTPYKETPDDDSTPGAPDLA